MTAGAPEKEDTVLIRMMVPRPLHDYLSILKTKTMLGASENDVAKFLLTQKLEGMLRERYHETQGVSPKNG